MAERFDVFELPVDWSYATGVESRAGDQTGKSNTLLGEGIRWGSTQSLVVRDGNPTPMNQFIRVQTNDPYARNWQIVGTVSASVLAWTLPLTDFLVWLEVLMGAGQGTVAVQFDIRALINLADPWYHPPRLEGASQVRPFVIGGGIVGRAIAARMVFQVPGLVSPSNLPVGASGIISPYAAGHGL